MVPTHPGSSQYSYLDLSTATPLSAVLGNLLGYPQLQLLYGFRKHAPQQVCAKESQDDVNFLQDLGIGIDTCMAVLNPTATTTTTTTTPQHNTTIIPSTTTTTKPKATTYHHEAQHIDCQNHADAHSF